MVQVESEVLSACVLQFGTAVQSPPPYFVGGDVIAMAGWFPDNEDLQIATSQFEDEGSTYSRDFAVLSLMEVLASDEANTILQVSARPTINNCPQCETSRFCLKLFHVCELSLLNATHGTTR